MFDGNFFNTERPFEASTLRIIDRKGETELFVPLKETRLTGTIDGPLAGLILTQVFRGVEGTDEVFEAVYRFPLPGDGAVHGAIISFGDTRIESKLVEREEAQKAYEKAGEKGDQAVLVEKEGDDVFTIHVTGLVPGEDIKVEISFSLWMRPRLEGLEFRFPLTIGQRYSRDDEGVRAKNKKPLEVAWDPGYRFGMDLECWGVGKPESETFLVNISEGEDEEEDWDEDWDEGWDDDENENDGENVDDDWDENEDENEDEDHGQRCSEGNDQYEGRRGFRLTLDDVYPDQDCVLHFPLLRETENASLQVSHYREGGRTWFMAMAVPPRKSFPGSSLQLHGREIIVLMDKSGSMTGPKWLAATEALKGFLERMDGRDRLNIGFFNTETRWVFKSPMPAGDASVARCLSALENEGPEGGTELGVSLEQALKMPKTGKNLARHVLVVTDAQVTDSGRIFQLVEEHAKTPQPRRVSIICIDSAPNSHLVLGIAERGRGEAYFLTSDPEEDEMERTLNEIFRSWSHPYVIDLVLEAEGRRALDASGVLRAGQSSGKAFIELGDLPSEKPVSVCGFFEGLKDPGRVLLKDGRGKLLAVSTVSGKGSKPVRRLCGAARIRRLEALLGSEYGEDEVHRVLKAMGLKDQGLPKTIYAENRSIVGRSDLEGLLRSESLASEVISVETSFIAVSRRGDAKVDVTAVVPNALPRGWDTSFIKTSHSMKRAITSLKDMSLSRLTFLPSDEMVFEASRPEALTADLDLLQSSIESGDIKTVEAQLRVEPKAVNYELPKGLRPLELAVKSGDPRIVEFLLHHGASLESAKPWLREWILRAVVDGNERVVEMLLRFGLDPNSRYGDETLLMRACHAGAHPSIIFLLVKSGADVNARDSHGETVLMKAAARPRNFEILKVLLGAGADPCIRSRNGMTAFHYLVDNII